jgi:hypothetical protein
MAFRNFSNLLPARGGDRAWFYQLFEFGDRNEKPPADTHGFDFSVPNHSAESEVRDSGHFLRFLQTYR